ncbi:MAG: dipeptide ABC transporter ATP-binding protein [Silvanigrellaceae bacterium]|nr:dipeptide ABC transporter ATP-binding protein [Silvanigrellaceae bacterium]
MASQDILEVKNLTKIFPISSGLFGLNKNTLKAVHDVSFSVKKGKTLGLVGESGCGKSTLGRTILKLLEPNSGEIIFDGKQITHLTQKQLRPLRKELQIIFQDPFASLNPRMTIREILSEPFEIHNIYTKKEELNKKVSELIEEVGLNKNSLDRYPHEFSGGQRQRIGIARALALHPKLIVCDEPVSALDVSIQSQILNLMMDLKDKYQLSYIFIAHDLAVIKHISDEVAVMYLGKIVEYASVDALYSSPTHPYTQALLSSIPKHDFTQKRVYKTIQGDVPSPINPPSGCHFHTRCPYAQEICKTTTPSDINLGNEENPHLVKCHFAEKIQKEKLVFFNSSKS